jgi:hypothetical protein
MRGYRGLGSLLVVGASACAVLIGVDEDYRERPLDGGAVDAGITDGRDAACAADVGTDPENCGACGVTCGPASRCDDGVCVDAEIVSATRGDPTAIAVDDTAVYWLDRGEDGVGAGGLYTCDKTAPCTPRLLTALTAPFAMALSDRTVYLTAKKADGSGALRLFRMSADVGDAGLVECHPGPIAASLHAVAAGPGRAWILRDNEIDECLPTCSDADRCFKIESIDQGATLTSDGTSIAWIDREGLSRCTPLPCTRAPLVLDSGLAPIAMAMDPATIFVATSTSDILLYDSPPLRRAGGFLGGASFMAIDGDDALVATTLGILRFSGAGGIVSAVAERVDAVAVVADDTHVYFTERRGRVLRIRK